MFGGVSLIDVMSLPPSDNKKTGLSKPVCLCKYPIGQPGWLGIDY